MLEYAKVESPALWPSACICGSQKGPLVDTFLDKPGYGGRMDGGRIYLCRLCVTRAGRALGLVKGEELTKLQNAGDLLAQAQKEIDERQTLLQQMGERAAERDRKIEALQGMVESMQADAASRKHLAELIASNARELTAA